MYNCIKFLNKIFLKLKNLISLNKIKIKKFFYLNKKIILKIFKLLIFNKNIIKKLDYNILFLRIKIFFKIFNV